MEQLSTDQIRKESFEFLENEITEKMHKGNIKK